MNDTISLAPRKRARTLLVVEGNHEKNELFKSLFKCFPELSIPEEDIWIYGTNIYVLHKKLTEEYGTDWNDIDIDLPLIISRDIVGMDTQNKNDFTNIILVFDYERHDTFFSEEKIEQMQSYFSDITDMGKLYINYPMIESYQHLHSIPDMGFENSKVSVTVRPGVRYKALVQDSFMDVAIQFPEKLKRYFTEKCCCSEDIAEQILDLILELPRNDGLSSAICGASKDKIASNYLQSTQHYICNLINKLPYISNEQNYWQYLRSLFQQVVKHNICKCSKILDDHYNLDDNAARAFLSEMDLLAILIQQNILSRDPNNGEIWVVNTCILMIAEYNYNLLLAV